MGSNWESIIRAGRHRVDLSSLDVAAPDKFVPSALFLGPNGENAAHLARLLEIAVEEHVSARRDYFPSDPNAARPEVMQGEAHAETLRRTETNLRELANKLRSSIPVASHRNQSHMYWDVTLPSVAGYVAAMLYNQNNVAAEGSPITTALEIEVGRQLCAMLGYDVRGEPEPWGHITCDGSVANIEAAWAARNLRFLAPALARAVREEAALEPARDVTVRQPDGGWSRLIDLDTWELLNLRNDDVLDLPERMVRECGADEGDVRAAIDRWSVQALGLAAFRETVLHDAVPATPAMILPATAHYSWPKAATLLGLGTSALIHVPVDLEGRMRLPELRRALEGCLRARRPVTMVTAVIGTTEESAVDPLDDIARLRDEFADRGLAFSLHADAAWGGYFASLLPRVSGGLGLTPVERFSPYVERQFRALAQADSITVDPHKAGFAPYPAGALCYRNGRMKSQVAITAPVVFHDGTAPSVGVYGVEGSKPGAAAAGVWLNHKTIPTDISGYGELLGRCLFNAKRFAAAVTTLARPEDRFIVVPFTRLPAEQDGGTAAEVAEQRALIAEKVVGFSNERLMEELGRDPRLREIFRRIGPDLTVFAYAFNLKRGEEVNRDLSLMNALNDAIFRRLSIEVHALDGKVPEQPMIVTASAFDPATYGPGFVDTFARRAGVEAQEGAPIRFVISTMQNPFVTDTASGNFIPTLAGVLRDTADDAVDEILTRFGGAR